MNKKKILTIIIVLVVLLLGGASVYVATQLSTRQAVAPTAPTSKPAAADCSAFTNQNECMNLDIIECTWIEECSKCAESNADPVTVCMGSGDGEETGWSSCSAITGAATGGDTVLTLVKEAYKDEATNTAGDYNLVTPITTVVPGQTFVYELLFENPGSETIDKILITDVLEGNNLDKLTFVDSDESCTYNATSRTVSCNIGVFEAGTKDHRSFRVKVADDVTDGMVIKNTAVAAYDEKTVTATKSLTVEVEISAVVELEGSKNAYLNATSNTPGVYALTTPIDTVSKNQIYVYSISITNTSEAVASAIVIKDSLKDMDVTFKDTEPACTWNATAIELTCNTSLQPGETKTFSFRVTANSGIANGDVITNKAVVTYSGGSLELIKDLTVSTVVGCNNTCTTNAECNNGLTCDTTANKCRATACLAEEDCVCTTPTATINPTTTAKPTATATPTKKVTPTKTVTDVVAKITPETLTDAGILDLPGIAAFGGGLLLAVIGILLAL